MKSVAIAALAMLESAQAFMAPVAAPLNKVSNAQMFSEGDIGVLPPLGVYDPLGLINSRNMYRYECMEIKHGRAAMLGFLHVIAIEVLLHAMKTSSTTDCVYVMTTSSTTGSS